jgi:hypothetical protein
MLPISRPSISRASAPAAEEAALNGLAPATRAAYAADWPAFTDWCRVRADEPLPAAPVVIAMYLPACAKTLAAASIGRRVASITHYHEQAGHPSPMAHPIVKNVWKGFHRRLKRSSIRSKTSPIRPICSPSMLRSKQPAQVSMVAVSLSWPMKSVSWPNAARQRPKRDLQDSERHQTGNDRGGPADANILGRDGFGDRGIAARFTLAAVSVRPRPS